MPDHKHTYQKQANSYEALVNREDFQSNILNTLKEICDLKDLDVLDTGCGTGRLACLLAPLVHSMQAFDSSLAMVKIAEQKLTSANQTNWRCGVADHRALPVPKNSANLIISGWSVCYLATWGNAAWQGEVIKAIEEFERVLRPAGKIIILESLGTGEMTPNPPQKLIPYLQFLEELGFSRCWIRTDYQFKSIAERDELISFFFGQEMIQAALSENPLVIPECTGIWKLDLS
jgi:ubiquinone/menaquinone biosynthesis C-methylase UbiE